MELFPKGLLIQTKAQIHELGGIILGNATGLHVSAE